MNDYENGFKDGLEFGRQWSNIHHLIISLISSPLKKEKTINLLSDHQRLYQMLKTIKKDDVQQHYRQLQHHRKKYQKYFKYNKRQTIMQNHK
jgi:hypothetical protein